MALRDNNHRSAKEGAINAKLVQLLLRRIRLDRLLKLSHSLLSTDNGCGLAVRSSFNVLNKIKQRIFAVSTSSRIVLNTAEIGCCYVIPNAINILKNSLAEGLAHLLDQLVEISLTSENTAKFLIKSDCLYSSRNTNGSLPADSLSADTLSTLGNLVNDKQVAVLDNELVHIALREVTIVNNSVEEIVLLKVVQLGLLKNFFDDSKHLATLAVTNSTDIKLGAAAVSLDESLTNGILRITYRIGIDYAVITVNGNLYNIFSIAHYF